MKTLGILVWLASAALGQVAIPHSSNPYRDFFAQVDMLARLQLSIQDAIPLSDPESKAVVEVSKNFEAQWRRISFARLQVQQEALLRFLDDEPDSPRKAAWKKDQLEVIENAEKQLASESVASLKSTLGPRFETLESYIKAGILTDYLAQFLPSVRR